ncbi:MAG: hypothetical protein JSW40_01615 [Candidatus Omnitrophota bacterium]|nr:MAG: hypothetical protein JSW40_01615 [Candidatus Omnitrophota bacterium]
MMRQRKTVLLFEVALVVLIVSIASLFLFRGYAIFLKVGKKSLDYLKLIVRTEEKMWDLHAKERNGEITADMDTEGEFDAQLGWHLSLEDVEDSNLKIGTLKATHSEKGVSFDTIIYLKGVE